MSRTVFSTPILTPILRLITIGIMRLCGWKLANKAPDLDKYVLLAAPHTSNWDFVAFIAAALEARVTLNWMGKHTLFPKPLRPVMIWLGGIPINRQASQNMVQQVVSRFESEPNLVVTIPPEGTRSKVERWKTGFYHIAQGANVPVVLGWLDFAKKEAGFGPAFTPTGDLEKDLAEIQDFYKDKTPKHPELF